MTGTRRTVGAVLVVALVAGLAVFAVDAAIAAVEGVPNPPLLGGWLYQAVVLGAGLTITLRAVLVRSERAAWALLGAGVLAWGVGDLYWWRALSTMDAPPFPSWADAGYLALYPLAYAAVGLLVSRRVGRFHASQWLDGLSASLVIAAAAAVLVMPPILAATSGTVAAVVTNLAYPLGDLLLAALTVALAGLLGWRPGAAVGMFAIGCLMFAVADAVYLIQIAEGSYTEGGILDVFWPGGLVLMALAAWWPTDPDRRARLEGWRVMVLPGVVSVTSLGLVVGVTLTDGDAAAVLLAAAALAVCLGRGALTFRENIALADSHRLAITDGLTGLPNRRLFTDRADQAVLRARRSLRRAAVLVIDLDRFTTINDALGHGAGDALLREVATRLRAAVRESDTVARLSGDEFALILPDIRDVEAARAVAETLHAAILRPVTLEGIQFDVEASIGIALFPDHGEEVPELLQRADRAMHLAKASRTGWETAGPQRDDAQAQLTLVADLRRAIDAGELVLHYQPKVDLADGHLAGVEALVRWDHPERGLLGPGEFVPLAEHSTIMRPLTLHILQRALAQCARWRAEGRGVPVAVNISARNLLDPGFADSVAAALRDAGVPADMLELEITESVLMVDPARAQDVLEALHATGVSLSIDDFGTGYSSLAYLTNLPVDVLKIDRSFVMNMATNPANATIVRSTIELGRNLGLKVVAEGIEDGGASDALRSMGCHLGQGYHIGRPVPAEDIARLLGDAVPV